MNPVICSTGVTGIPASDSVRAVEPVDTNSTPAAPSAVPSSTRRVLSYTEISARRSGRRPVEVRSASTSDAGSVYSLASDAVAVMG